MTRTIAATAFAALLFLLAAPAGAVPLPMPDGGDGPSGSANGTGVVITDSNPGSTSPGHPGDVINAPAGSTGPVYDDYYTPACSSNGPPPGDGGALCMGAVTICDNQGQDGALYMQHWRRMISPRVGTWEFVGSVCRGPNEPTDPLPAITVPMVLDAAYAAAPRPTAMVQPGTRSFVNVPNNYYADAQDQTVTVQVLGQPIAVTFTIAEVRWDFGDGGTATGPGIEDAALQQAGAIEHLYARQGSYDITATSVIDVSFTAPGLGAQNVPGALELQSDPVTLPVGEIQTRVDATR